jgi:hypothetical protein
VQDVRADLRAEVDVLRLALLTGDLLAAAALLQLDEAGAQHVHRRLLVGALGALVLALDDDAGRAVRDPYGGVGLVDVLPAGTGGAVGVDLQVVLVDLDVAALLDDRGHLDAGERGLTAVGRVEGREAHEPVHALLGGEEPVGVVAGRAEGRRLDAGLLPRAGLQQLHAEAPSLGPAHEHAQDHLGPVLGVRAARAGVDGDERVARVVGAGEQALLLERLQPLLDPGELGVELSRQVGVLLGQLGEVREVGHVAVQRAVGLEMRELLANRGDTLGRRLGVGEGGYGGADASNPARDRGIAAGRAGRVPR